MMENPISSKSEQLVVLAVAIEELFSRTVNNGRWHWLVLFYLSLLVVPDTIGTYILAFIAPIRQEYWCKPPDDFSGSLDKWIAANHVGGKHWHAGDINKCLVYGSGNSSNEIPCPVMQYNADTGVTVMESFQLGCDEDNWLSMIYFVYGFGLMIGNISFGLLCDKIGRKKVLFISLGVQPLAGLAAGASPSFELFCIARFVLGLATGGTVLAGYLLVNEVFGNRRRSLACSLFFLPMGPTILLLAGFAEVLGDWRHLQLVLSVPPACLFVFMGFVPESPLWLLTQRQAKLAKVVFRKAARMNQHPLPSTFTILPQDDGDFIQPDLIAVKENIWQLFGNCSLLTMACALWVLSVGISLSLTFILSFMSEFPLNGIQARCIVGVLMTMAVVTTTVAVPRFGHRKVLCIVLLLAAGFNGLGMLFYSELGGGTDNTLVVLFSFSMYLITMAFIILLNMCARMFPTTIRGFCLGLTFAVINMATIFTPSFHYDLSEPIVLTVGVTFMLAVICFALLLVPRVDKRELPDSIADAVHFSSQVKPIRWTTIRPRSVTFEEMEIQQFNMESDEQPVGLDFSKNPWPKSSTARSK